MTELQIYLVYMTAWVVYQLWSIHKWMRKDEEKVTAESVGTELHDMLNFVSKQTIANVALVAFIFLNAFDVFGILLVKGFVQEPEWISYVLMGLVCVTIVHGVRMVITIYRLILRATNSCKPDLFMARHERLFKKGRVDFEVIVIRTLNVLYAGFGIYTIVILLQTLHIL